MKFAFNDELIVTTHFDPEMAMLADRHYSRRTVGARQFLYSGRKLVIRNAEGTILFGWVWPEEQYRMDGQAGFNCAIFRNESVRRASDIILECESLAVEKWGTEPRLHLCGLAQDPQQGIPKTHSRLLLPEGGMGLRSR